MIKRWLHKFKLWAYKIQDYPEFYATWDGGTLLRNMRESQNPMLNSCISWIDAYAKREDLQALELVEFHFTIKFRRNNHASN